MGMKPEQVTRWYVLKLTYLITNLHKKTIKIYYSDKKMPIQSLNIAVFARKSIKKV